MKIDFLTSPLFMSHFNDVKSGFFLSENDFDALDRFLQIEFKKTAEEYFNAAREIHKSQFGGLYEYPFKYDDPEEYEESKSEK